MSKSLYRNALITLFFGASLASAGLATADDAAATQVTADAAQAQDQQQADWDKVLQLGKIDVQASREEQSRRIVAGLKVIKHALKTSLSNDPADAGQVVCRMNYDTGSHLNAHLMCATNRTLMIYRDQLHTAMLAGTYGQPDGAVNQMLEQLKGHAQPGRYFSTSISAAELQKLLLQVQCDGCTNSGLVVGNN